MAVKQWFAVVAQRLDIIVQKQGNPLKAKCILLTDTRCTQEEMTFGTRKKTLEKGATN